MHEMSGDNAMTEFQFCVYMPLFHKGKVSRCELYPREIVRHHLWKQCRGRRQLLTYLSFHEETIKL